jgi:translation initiation factor IF-3
VVDVDGKQLGIMPIADALRVAGERELDLVEVAANVKPPVCKILDFGKYRYQLSKKQTQKRSADIKEIKIRPQITEHDLGLKVKSIRRFLDEGNKAKVMMFFRGREIIRPELGMKSFQKILETLTGKFNVEQSPRLEGKNITMILTPK